MSEWKDISNYSQGQKDRTPVTWSMNLADFRLVVTRTHGIEDVWFIDSGLTGRRELKSAAIDEAKNEALKMLRAKLKAIISELPIL